LGGPQRACTIVIDTGFDETEARRRDRQLQRLPIEAPSLAGVAVDVTPEVVITHLHYDHAGSLAAFANARFHLQAAEMAYATGPCMCHAHLQWPFTAEHVCEVVRKVYSGRVVFHDGDAEIAPGITLHRIGGHGLQCVRVMTGTGPVVLASDATHFYENFETGKVGYARLEQLAGSRRRIVPGHDPLVTQRYPALNGDTLDIVHRVDLARLDA
jgi:glyoxylase-like metal-dependent hydrolase (beta-lactamase superfamily II)